MSLRSLFGFGERSRKVKAFLDQGAVIIDLRPEEDFDRNPIQHAKNINLEEMDQHLEEIKKLQPVIICCSTGFRSDAITILLRKLGINAVNGGSWKRVRKIVNEKNGNGKF